MTYQVYLGAASYKRYQDTIGGVPSIPSGTFSQSWDATNGHSFFTISGTNNETLNCTETTSFWSAIVGESVIYSGKVYWEIVLATDSFDYWMMGVGQTSKDYTVDGGHVLASISYYTALQSVATWYRGTQITGTLLTGDVPDVIGIAFNADDKELSVYKNNVFMATASTTDAIPFSPFFAAYRGAGCTMNSTESACSYSPPTGYSYLN